MEMRRRPCCPSVAKSPNVDWSSLRAVSWSSNSSSTPSAALQKRSSSASSCLTCRRLRLRIVLQMCCASSAARRGERQRRHSVKARSKAPHAMAQKMMSMMLEELKKATWLGSQSEALRDCASAAASLLADLAAERASALWIAARAVAAKETLAVDEWLSACVRSTSLTTAGQPTAGGLLVTRRTTSANRRLVWSASASPMADSDEGLCDERHGLRL
eukprot:scaffold319532_cov28-Tisochrysis_lutea.AAC.2